MKQSNPSGIFVAFLIMASATACTEQAGKDPVAEQNIALIEAYVSAANRGDASYLDQYLAPAYVYHGPAGELDKAGFKAFHDEVLSAFSELAFRIEDTIADGDKVVTRWRFRGVHTGEFQGIAPTGNEVNFTGIIITRFQDGKAVEEWEEADLLSLLQQLGAIAMTANGSG